MTLNEADQIGAEMAKFIGIKQNGSLSFKPGILKYRQDYINSLKDNCQIVETITKISKSKSQEQLGYIFGGIKFLIKQKFDEMGLDICGCPINDTQIMDILYLACGDGKRLSGMNMDETRLFIERVLAWCAKELGLYIPDPDVNWKESNEQDKN